MQHTTAGPTQQNRNILARVNTFVPVYICLAGNTNIRKYIYAHQSDLFAAYTSDRLRDTPIQGHAYRIIYTSKEINQRKVLLKSKKYAGRNIENGVLAFGYGKGFVILPLYRILNVPVDENPNSKREVDRAPYLIYLKKEEIAPFLEKYRSIIEDAVRNTEKEKRETRLIASKIRRQQQEAIKAAKKRDRSERRRNKKSEKEKRRIVLKNERDKRKAKQESARLQQRSIRRNKKRERQIRRKRVKSIPPIDINVVFVCLKVLGISAAVIVGIIICAMPFQCVSKCGVDYGREQGIVRAKREAASQYNPKIKDLTTNLHNTTKNYEHTIDNLKKQHSDTILHLESEHTERRASMESAHTSTIDSLWSEHTSTIDSLRNEHNAEMNQIHQTHQQELEHTKTSSYRRGEDAMQRDMDAAYDLHPKETDNQHGWDEEIGKVWE
jgi:flagellar biosynthesis GTPase FlhF